MINVEEFRDLIKEIVRDELGDRTRYRIAEIASVGDKVSVIFSGEPSPSQKQYTYLKSYYPKVGDRVWLAKDKGTYVVLGKIDKDVSTSIDLNKDLNVNGDLNVEGDIISDSILNKQQTEKLIEDVSIGGRNLLKNGEVIKNSGQTKVYPFTFENIEYLVGERMTISFLAKLNDSGINGNRIDAYLRSDGIIGSAMSQTLEVTNEWKRYNYTFTINQEMVNDTTHFYIRNNRHVGNNSDDISISVKEVMIEASSKPSSWMPAIGDIIDSGSNDNGEWIRFDDGWQICRRIIEININEKSLINYLYSKDFIELPFVSWSGNATTSRSTMNGYRGIIAMAWYDSWRIDVLGETGYVGDINRTLSLVAIGKWK